LVGTRFIIEHYEAIEAMMSTLQDILGWQLLSFMYLKQICEHRLGALSVS
jgi:hypothetical protein